MTSEPIQLSLMMVRYANATSTGNVGITIKNVVAANKAPTTPTGTVNVNEGTADGVVVVTLDDKDDDNQTITYTFAATGTTTSADNKFKIVNNTIVANGAVADVTADTALTYSVIANDGSGAANATSTGNVGITIKNVVAANKAPTTPTGAVNVNEGTADGVVVVTLDDKDDDNQTITYTFAATGTAFSADNKFKIVSNTIVANGAVADVTADTALTYSVIANDGSGAANATVTGNISITVKDATPINTAPTGLYLSNGSVLEYAAVGAEIGTLNAVDPNGDALTYKLLDNAGGGRFAIVGNKLVLAGQGVNFEEAKSHQLKVQVSDGKARCVRTDLHHRRRRPAYPQQTGHVKERQAERHQP